VTRSYRSESTRAARSPAILAPMTTPCFMLFFSSVNRLSVSSHFHGSRPTPPRHSTFDEFPMSLFEFRGLLGPRWPLCKFVLSRRWPRFGL
jgi:hypothetical protein